MPNITNPHAQRLYDSLLNHTNEQTAEKIVCDVKIGKSLTEEKKMQWVTSICKNLEDNFDDITIKDIRLHCCCDAGVSKAQKMKKLFESSKDLYEFADRFNAAETYAKLMVADGCLHFIYPNCYCSMIKRNDLIVSKTWCYCTLGYTKFIFEAVFNHEVEVELLESIKTGGNQCVIKVVV